MLSTETILSPLSNKCCENIKKQHVLIKSSVKLAFKWSTIFHTTVRASEVADTPALKFGLFVLLLIYLQKPPDVNIGYLGYSYIAFLDQLCDI
jgi:hypothetical protein